MNRIVPIVTASGVHPENLDLSVLEQKMLKEDRMRPIKPDTIFVFGSNEAGFHGAGAARYAHEQLDAKMGVSFGPTGRCFAIPTKDDKIRNTLPIRDIDKYVKSFLGYAAQHPNKGFQVTCIGCGLAGLKHSTVAIMFFRAPPNCYFDLLWEPHLSSRAKFWGTF